MLNNIYYSYTYVDGMKCILKVANNCVKKKCDVHLYFFLAKTNNKKIYFKKKKHLLLLTRHYNELRRISIVRNHITECLDCAQKFIAIRQTRRVKPAWRQLLFLLQQMKKCPKKNDFKVICINSSYLNRTFAFQHD